ncbi:MAG: hypothetical protein GXP62_20770, partial [Oligoflexia bacterium]|nr:hypothetical protein [Oligoflexia bacterium]
MTTTLNIRWDGTAPGLQEHRISLGLWLKPLSLLLKAVRRTATGILTEAIDDPQYGAGGGRLHKIAKGLDLEIVAIKDGCVQVEAAFALEPPVGQLGLDYDDLIKRTAVRVVKSIERESRGEVSNYLVRQFLEALPSEVEIQQYQVVHNGNVVAATDVEELRLPEIPAELPTLKRLTGRVIGVSFDEGKESVSIKADGRSTTLKATLEQVECALNLRDSEIEAMVVSGDRARLVWLKVKDGSTRMPTEKHLETD